MSLQDHGMQIYPNISRKTKFMKNFKFLKYSVYRPLMTCFTPLIKGKSIRYLEPEKQMYKVLSHIHYNTIVKLNTMHKYLLIK